VKIPLVSNAELGVLQLLWDQGRLTTRQIARQLYPKQTASDLATVQKLVERLEQKGLVERDRSSFVHTISPLVDRDRFAGQRLAEAAAKLARGSLKPLLAHLVESDQLSREDLEDIRKLIDKHRKKRQLQ
jgi:BlaI family transcriptional regulator, penicillinase repressor